MVPSDRASTNRHNLQPETLMIIRVNNTVIESEALEEATEAVGHAATWTGEETHGLRQEAPDGTQGDTCGQPQVEHRGHLRVPPMVCFLGCDQPITPNGESHDRNGPCFVHRDRPWFVLGLPQHRAGLLCPKARPHRVGGGRRTLSDLGRNCYRQSHCRHQWCALLVHCGTCACQAAQKPSTEVGRLRGIQGGASPGVLPHPPILSSNSFHHGSSELAAENPQ